MTNIKSFSFDKDTFQAIRSHNFGTNWPVVYLIEDGKELYVGETTNVFSRSNQHYDNPERKKLTNIHIITDEEYNKSATLDVESSLIQYLSAEGTYVLQNSNSGLLNHNYYDRDRYRAKFETTWAELKYLRLVKKDLIQIKNSNLFKYSPYKALSIDQLEVSDSLINSIKKNDYNAHLISGDPGTGKTILAIYISLKD